jgi:chemotaxis protein methyltransferase CheR
MSVANVMAMTDREFEDFRALVYTHTGIAMGPAKRQLLQSRLARRLRALGLETYAAYHRWLTREDSEREELTCFINAVTTNKTEFFREPHHFAWLRRTWEPGVRDRLARGGRVRIWSAGCSTGEEPFTIALVVRDALGALPGVDLKVLASDIDTDVLAHAAAGVYTMEQVVPVPEALLRRQFQKGIGRHAGLVRVRAETRDLVAFRRLNLLDPVWPMRAPFDVIFCRNVLIYFDAATQRRVVTRLAASLADGGYLVLGHAENLHGFGDGLRHVANTIYQREGVTSCPPRS